MSCHTRPLIDATGPTAVTTVPVLLPLLNAGSLPPSTLAVLVTVTRFGTVVTAGNGTVPRLFATRRGTT